MRHLNVSLPKAVIILGALMMLALAGSYFGSWYANHRADQNFCALLKIMEQKPFAQTTYGTTKLEHQRFQLYVQRRDLEKSIGCIR